LDINLGKLAEKRKTKMVDFAIKSEFKIDAAITKVYSETTELQKREIERL